MAGGKADAGGGAGWRPGGTGPARRGPRPEWMPTAEAPKRHGRRLKQFGLAGLTLGVLGLIGLLIWWLWPSRAPALVLVAAPPDKHAGRLDAPIDPYGWASAGRLEKWAADFRAGAPDAMKPLAPTVTRLDATPADPGDPGDRAAKDLADRAAAAANKSKSAVVYFGLHTGADADGPFLFTGGGGRLRVKALLQHLAEATRGKAALVVIFDPARLPAQPALGLIADDFVRGVKALDADIVQHDNLTVILGCDEGERGWESEEWQRTALAHSTIKGLSGRAKDDGAIVSALDLFAFVKEDVSGWTRKNRPGPQTPVLLPAGQVGVDRATAVPLVPDFDLPAEDTPPGTAHDPLPELQRQWDGYDQLARQVPSPAAHTPRRWRRYRELLQRYEFVARSGEAAAGRALEDELKKEADALRAAIRPPIENSRTASTPLWHAATDHGAAGPDLAALLPAEAEFLRAPGAATADAEFARKFQEATGGAERKTAAQVGYSHDLIERAVKSTLPLATVAPHARLLRAVWGDQLVRPPETQLALMLGRFYAPAAAGGLVADPLPAGPDPDRRVWQRALDTRRLAEEVAVGFSPRGPAAYPYSEAVWPVVRDAVAAADKDRREGEDLLFAPPTGPYHRQAWDALGRAADGYEKARGQAEQVRRALATRDEVTADLPHLGRWLAADGTAAQYTAAVDLWEKAHELAADLDKTPPVKPADLAAAADAVERPYRDLRAAYDDKLKNVSLAKLQAGWAEREQLLSVPPLAGAADAAATRTNLVRVNRESTRYFNDARADAPAARPPDAAAGRAAREEVARRLGRLAVRELGTELIDRQNKTGKAEVNAAGIEAKLAEIRGDQWAAAAAAAGTRIGQSYLLLAETADPEPVAPEAERLPAERASRVAVAFAPPSGAEPAETNRRWRWRRLFAGLARRAVLDHWYDNGVAYHQKVAEAFLRDADALAPAEPTPAGRKLGRDLPALLGDAEAAETDTLYAAPPLAVTRRDDAGVIRWTTEAQRDVRFWLKAALLPPGGRPVVWAAAAPKLPPEVQFAAGAEARRILDSAAGPLDFPVPVAVVAERAKTADLKLDLRRDGFFRGQAVGAAAAVRLTRSPDLIYTLAPPAPDDAPHVAFLGPDNIELGAVAFVIDFSPSMGLLTAPKSRINRALGVLETVLKGIPDGTRLSIRGFGVAGLTGEKVAADPYESVFTAGGTDIKGNAYKGTHDRRLTAAKAVVNWGAVPDNLKTLMSNLRATKQAGDEGFTPLVRTMVHAVKEDFEDVPADKSRLLIVLTDGKDNSTTVPKNDPSAAAPSDFVALENALKAGFKDRLVTARLLLIAEDAKAEEIAEFEKQFKDVLEQQFNPPGRVQQVKKTEELAAELAELLRPRVILRPADPTVPSPPAARNGLSLRFDNRTPVESPDWAGGRITPPGQYLARVGFLPERGRDQAIELAPADRLLVRLRRAGERVGFERGVWGELLQPGLRKANRIGWQAADASWLLTAAGYRTTATGYQGELTGGEGLSILDLLAAVENVEEGLRKPDGITDPVRQIAPDFVWWELDPAVAATKLRSKAPVYVWREYGFPAPTWRVRRWDWRGENTGAPEAALRGWVMPQAAFKPADRTVLTGAAGPWAGRMADGREWRDEWAGRLPDGREWKATFNWEPHGFARSGDAEKPEERNCLAVRVYFTGEVPAGADGRPAPPPLPALVRVPGASLEEHRFFRSMGAYTGYFAGFTREQAVGRAVELFSVADLVGARGVSKLELKLPEPFDDGPMPARIGAEAGP